DEVGDQVGTTGQLDVDAAERLLGTDIGLPELVEADDAEGDEEEHHDDEHDDERHGLTPLSVWVDTLWRSPGASATAAPTAAAGESSAAAAGVRLGGLVGRDRAGQDR